LNLSSAIACANDRNLKVRGFGAQVFPHLIRFVYSVFLLFPHSKSVASAPRS
jgi:hypothetical protein